MADAIEFRARGNWVISFGYGENGNFQGSYKGHQAPGWEPGADKLALQERIQLQLETIISASLSSFIGVEMGGFTLGNQSQGAALGTDQIIVKFSSAYLDWRMPGIPLKTRLGLQSIVTPALASGNSVLNGTMAGAATSLMLGESLASSAADLYQGLFPAGGARHRNFSDANGARRLSNYGSGWWAGLSASFRGLDPFRLGLDAEAGEMRWNDDMRLLRHGWFGALLLEWHLDWGVPGVYFWASSGDDANPANGSERMPALDPANSSNFSRFAFDGAPYLERNALIANNLAGTWGVGIRLRNLEITGNWRQILRVNLICGANSPQMAKKMSLAGLWANGLVMEPNFVGNGAGLGMPGLYLTTLDKALELGTSALIKFSENFSLNLEGDYIALWLDVGEAVWGATHRNGQSVPQTRDAWNVNATFVFDF